MWFNVMALVDLRTATFSAFFFPLFFIFFFTQSLKHKFQPWHRTKRSKSISQLPPYTPSTEICVNESIKWYIVLNCGLDERRCKGLYLKEALCCLHLVQFFTATKSFFLNFSTTHDWVNINTLFIKRHILYKKVEQQQHKRWQLKTRVTGKSSTRCL